MTYQREQELIDLAKKFSSSDMHVVCEATGEVAFLPKEELIFVRALSQGIRIGKKLAQDDAIAKLIGVGNAL